MGLRQHDDDESEHTMVGDLLGMAVYMDLDGRYLSLSEQEATARYLKASGDDYHSGTATFRRGGMSCYMSMSVLEVPGFCERSLQWSIHSLYDCLSLTCYKKANGVHGHARASAHVRTRSNASWRTMSPGC